MLDKSALYPFNELYVSAFGSCIETVQNKKEAEEYIVDQPTCLDSKFVLQP